MQQNRGGTWFKSLCYFLVFILIFSSIPFYNLEEVKAKKPPVIQDASNKNEVPTSKYNLIMEKGDKEKEKAGLKEVPSLRGEASKVYVDSEGTYLAEVYLEPIHYEENGEWEEINNDLIDSKDGQHFENKQNAFSVKFPKKPFSTKEKNLLTYKAKGHEMSIDFVNESKDKNQYVDVQTVEPIVSENQITFEDAFKDVSLEYTVEGSKVKENIILQSYQGKNVFQFELNVKDLKAVKQEDGSIHFYDSKGKFIFLIERPYMYDSNTKVGPEGAVSEEITQDIEKTETGYLLTITADEAFLTDPSRVYPVTIDPWIDVFQAEDTFVASGTSYNYHNTDYLFVGNHSTVGKTRSLLKFQLPTIPNGVVTGASLGVYQSAASDATAVNLHKLTSSFATTSVTWANQPSFAPTEIASSNKSTQGYTYFPVTDLVKEWYETPAKNYGVVLKYPDSLEGSATRKSYYSTELITEDGSLFGKPKLLVEFRPSELLGLTDYWTYTPDIFQGEGTGVVNVINGNMVYDISLLDVKGKTGAFNLGLTYNSRSNYNMYYGLGWMFSAQESLFVNSDQSIIEYRTEGGARYHFTKKQDDDDVTYSSPEGVQYELTKTASGFELKDTSETIRYFDSLGRNYEIKDEKGNRIIYTFENTTSSRVVKITERTGTAETGRSMDLSYNVNGSLSKVTDFNGNTTELNYEQVDGTNYLKTITYAKSSKVEKTIQFNYYPTTKRLKSVTDANGNVGTIEYDEASNRVTKLIDPRSDSIFSSLQYYDRYTIFTDSKGNKTQYAYSPLNASKVNVTSIVENFGTADATTTTYSWKDNLLESESEPNQETGAASVTTSATYDNKGNLVSAKLPDEQYLKQTVDNKSNVTNASDSSGVFENYIYDEKSNLKSTTTNFGLTDYNDYDQYGNIIRSVSTTRDNYNRLINAQFEIQDTSGLPLNWSRYTSATSGTYQLSNTSFSGNKSAQITLSGTATAGYYSQQFAVDNSESNKVYTIGSQVKTENVTGEGVRLRVYPLNSSKVQLTNKDGSRIEFVTAPITGTVDWTRLSDTFTLPSETAYVRVDLLFKGEGKAYFDDTQVTYGTTLNQFATNENASFELGSGTTADDWTLNNFATGDGRSTSIKYAGAYSTRLTGATNAARYSGQFVDIKVKKGDPVTISGWGYTTNGTKTGKFTISLFLTNASGTSKKYELPFMQGENALNQWQFAKNTFLAEEDFVRAKVYLNYENRTGYGYFDNIKVEQTGSAISKSYTNFGTNLAEETDTQGNITKFSYDSNGNEKSETDPNNVIKTRGYDALDRLESVTIGDGVKAINSSYGFDKQGNITSRTNPLGYVTSFKYNALNEVEREIDPLGKYHYYEYDGEANVTLIESGDGTKKSSISFTYDHKNNEKSKSVNGAKLFDKTYFKNNLLKTIQVNGVSTPYEFNYDDSKRLTKAKTPDGYSLTNVYETAVSNPANGLRTSYTESLTGVNASTKFAYDGLQRLTSITTAVGKSYNYFYNESSQPVRLQSDSSTQLLDFDTDGQLIKQSIFGKDLLQLRYQYQANGNIKTYFDGTKTHTYKYDFADRLASWDNGTKVITYDYDDAGNLLNLNGKSYTYNEANEINGLTYDFEGNLINDDRLTYKWDGLGQLTETTEVANSANKVTYTYHPDGLRKTKTDGATTYNYYYDDSNLVRVTDANHKTIWAITWNNGKVVNLTNAAGESFEYVTNHRGDVVRILDQNGATVATYDYDPWGNLLTVEPTDSRIKGQPIRYAGYVYDAETKLYYLQARYYDPATARFISRDPDPGDEDDPITMNGYTYGDNNPITKTDPDGKWVWLVINAGFAIYDGYKAYKAGKNKKQIAWAVASNYLGIGKIKKATRIVKAINKGRTGKQVRLKEIANDPKVSSALRGSIKSDINAMKRGKRKSLRVPKGHQLAHRRGFEARKGFGYEYSDLQTIRSHRTQHHYDNNGKKR